MIHLVFERAGDRTEVWLPETQIVVHQVEVVVTLPEGSA